MSDSMRQLALRVSTAARESRVLVTALLPAASYGLSQWGEACSFSESVNVINNDPNYVPIRTDCDALLAGLGFDPSGSVHDLPLVLSAFETAVFVVQYARVIGRDPEDVWQEYLTSLARVECALDN